VTKQAFSRIILFRFQKYRNNKPNSHNHVHHVPEFSTQCNFEKWLEQQSKSDVNYHFCLSALLVGLVGKNCKTNKSCNPYKLKKPVRHIKQAKEKQYGKNYFNCIYHFLFVFMLIDSNCGNSVVLT
jgi:hypothetical protein